MTNTVYELRNEYRELTNRAPDKRWGEKRLLEMIADATEKKRLAEQRVADEAARVARIAAERQQRINERGSWEEFIDNAYLMERTEENQAERRFAQIAGEYNHDLRRHDAMAADFAKEYAAHPKRAMEWAGKMYEHAAKLEIASNLKHSFEIGLSAEEVADNFVRDAFRKVRGNSRSTSQTSNLMDDCMNEELAKVAKQFLGVGW